MVSCGRLVLLLAGLWLSAPAEAVGPGIITHGESSQPEVALTFDDGPSPRYTPQILALLQRYQAGGTFFVLGRKVEEHPGIIKAMLAAGHEVGNHSYSHPHLPRLNQLARTRELEKTSLALDLLGCLATEKMVRPPYSEYDRRLVSYVSNTDREMILWSVDSGDWQGLAAQAIADKVLRQVKPGSIIIFHDSDESDAADRRPTVAALKIILPTLQRLGYRMVTVSELLDRPKFK
jgi:peptidoglycan/xylan/chitin deacetylase (PgdA/CDA1 family)